MKVYKSIKTFQRLTKATATIGIFDGVHLGHQQLIQQLRTRAQEVGDEVVVVTFWPHPKLVLASAHTASTQILTTFSEKVAILSQLGIDYLLKIRFTKNFSKLDAEAFVQQVLVTQVGVTQLVVGNDHRFGKNRVGSIALLQKAGLHNNFTVKEVAPTLINGVTICSTEIRNLLLEGNVEKAQAYLGRPYGLNCSILQQDSDRTQGLKLHLAPTSPHKLVPADGLYIVQIAHRGGLKEGTLRIAREYTAPTIVLFVSDYPSATWYASRLDIQFKNKMF